MVEQPFKHMRLAPKSYTNITESVLKKAKTRIVRVKARDIRAKKKRELKYIKYIFERTVTKIKKIYTSIPRIDNLHPFYKSLVSLIIDVDRFRMDLAILKSSTEVLNKILREESRKIRRAKTITELREIRKEAIGRYFSVMKRMDDILNRVRGMQLKLIKLQAIDPTLITIVVAGPPNVGKSSFVRAVSRAKPEVREYPFTTKSITIGHIFKEGYKIQILDTPGLLDRPLDKRNPIEMQSIISIKYLASIVLVLLDPSETCGYPIDYQLNVLYDIWSMFKNIPIIVALNKIDLKINEEKINRIKSQIAEKTNIHEIYTISIEKKINVNKILQVILDKIRVI